MTKIIAFKVLDGAKITVYSTSFTDFEVNWVMINFKF